MEQIHIVDFETYCKTCAYEKTDEAEKPCDECVGVPARENSRKPVNWKEKSKNGSV